MNKLSYYIIGIIGVLIILTNCKKDDDLDDINSGIATKHPTPVWEGNWLAGDPSIIRIDNKLLMYYTSLIITGDGDGDNPDNLQIVISVAESSDGINWDFAKPLYYGESVALENDINSWDKILETAFVKKINNEFFMYYTGYSEGVDGVNNIVANGKIGVAKSHDGLIFERFLDDPILLPDSDVDIDGLFSPSVIKHDNTYYMIYAGWALDNHGYGLFGATSNDGINWQKGEQLLISNSEVGWSLDNPREAELVKAPDGMFYLFFTSDIAHNNSSIGLARSENPFGPWEVYPKPIISKTHEWEDSGIIAPAVLIENNKIHVWYMAEINNFSNFYIGYAEIEYPIDW